MRGSDIQQSELFSYGSVEERIPANHPLRAIRAMVDEALKEMSGRFDRIYGKDGDQDPLNPQPPDHGGNPTVNWHKEKRANDTHESRTDPMARLYKKTRGAEARLGYLGHVLTENRNGLVVDVRLTQAGGTAEREAALTMLTSKPACRRITLGGDRGYDTRGFVAATRELNVTPHVAQNDCNRRSAIDERTTRHQGYGVSQRKRKRVEEVFGWIKTIALQRKTRFRGLERVGWMFTFAAAAYNLVRMRNLQLSIT